MRENSYRAGKLSDSHVLGRRRKARNIALHLRIPVRQLESERDGLGMNAVRASNHRRVLELPGAAFEHLCEMFKILRDQR